MTSYDVAIVGGGMVGASFALALRGTRLRVLLIENVAPDSASQPSFDERTTALGNGSRQVFEGLGVWPAMSAEAAPIRSIHVSDAGRFGMARLDAKEQGVQAFGYVVPNRVIGRVLWQALASAPNVTLAVPAQLKHATLRDDGVRLEITRNAATDKPHAGEAFERFTASGPLAVLPTAGGGYTVVWAVRPARAAELLALGDEAFAAELLAAFGWRAGRWTRMGRRNQYPLALSRATETVAGRVVLIGNAAQALHPVAGQGFNLGLRDAATLAEMLAGAASDPDFTDLLARFSAWRGEDRKGVTRFTDGLVKLFGSDLPGLGLVRNFGLLLFDLSPTAKRALSRVSWGFAGRMPRLARGLPLE
jgi:2-octaprenyl-6-methoxyphenol hydroxylase